MYIFLSMIGYLNMLDMILFLVIIIGKIKGFGRDAKGIQAKGKKASQYDVKEVRFIEPLHKPEDDLPTAEPEVIENQAGEIDNSDVEDPIDIDDDQLTLF